MANPQPTDAHLRIAHQISEQLMVSHFTAKQRRILDLILRLSWGCGKKQAHIPLQRDFEVIGIGEGHIKGELDILIRDKVLERDEDTYWFNKDFDKWRVSRARGYSQEKLTELVSLNLNHIGKNLPNREVENHNNLPKREAETYRNGKKELTEMGSSSDTESATPKEIVKESIKESIYILVFDHWNQQNIIAHKKLTDDTRSVIARTLRSYSAEEIKVAISNYAEIVNNEQYFFKYKWTLRDFLRRGLEKFIDIEIAKSNFRRDKDGKAKGRGLPQTYTPSTNDDI